MGKLFVVVGSTGVGKTTLTRLLCRETGCSAGLEDHAQRPFQVLFKTDVRYALPNQLDFLLHRMEQEALIRCAPTHGILDGGLEMDFHGFTRLFHVRGWLSDSDFEICRHLYTVARNLLPPPEGIIHLTASQHEIEQRLAYRQRINIASVEDVQVLDAGILEWLAGVDPRSVITVDGTGADPAYSQVIPGLVAFIKERLNCLN